ncbi:MAG: GHMP kinase, partial [Thermoplasmata archaeon]
MPILRSKAPLRISFAGGGTDVSPYPEQKGGAVLNCTIDKFAYASMQVDKDGQGRTRVRSLDYNLTVDYERGSHLVFDGKLDRVKAALRILHPGPDAGQTTADSITLALHSDAPPGTGLGSSST